MFREKLLARKAVVKFAKFCEVSDTAASQWLSCKMNSRNMAAKALEFEKLIDSEQPII